jgi:hypothetical protein
MHQLTPTTVRHKLGFFLGERVDKPWPKAEARESNRMICKYMMKTLLGLVSWKLELNKAEDIAFR